MIDTDGDFYLGRMVDPATGKTGEEPLLYDPDDLNTHAVVVGMTGSGKTGLCIDLLEEAALNGVPALMIDPKGDITNALLHFPDLAPADFRPWINADEARKDGKSVDQAAQETAALWRNGLASWEIGPERLRRLKESVQFAVYTPGSDAGLPVSILASLQAPEIDWESNKDSLRDRISGTATALLGLIGLKDIDPVRSREHILLANIFENAWSQGQDLDLGELIMQVQAPPFEKLGVFPVDRFFPEKDRFELAMLLNNILAAPTFQSWLEGEPLNVGRLLYHPDGRPRHTIFYIAHLSDAERMFFVTLLYAGVETWMRSQSGTTSLRALIYFDEIFGYLPPTANPPSKTPMLRLLKQARAFGVGLVLATQNPVDIDYKALSNAGTWFIGKLGTDQDKQRLLDGLSSAMGGGMDRAEYDNLISALGKRVFLLRNVHEKRPVIFQTRWAMNYLAGPVTRTRIPELNALAGAAPSGAPADDPRVGAVATPQAAPVIPAATYSSAAPTSSAGPEAAVEPARDLGSQTRPPVPGRVAEFFLPQRLTLSEAAHELRLNLGGTEELGLRYRPVLLAQADVRYIQRKYRLSFQRRFAALVHELDARGFVHWDGHLVQAIETDRLDRSPLPRAYFAPLEGGLTDARLLKTLEADYVDWIYRSGEVMVRANEALDVYAAPDETDDAFRRMVVDAAEPEEEKEARKVQETFQRKLDALKKKLADEQRELAEDEDELSRRKREEAVKHAETLFGFFTGRRRSVSSSMTKRSMTARAKDDVEESKEEIARLEREIADLEKEATAAIREVDEKWDDVVNDITDVPITPFKKDINVELFGVAWLPYYLLDDRGQVVELPAFQEKPNDA